MLRIHACRQPLSSALPLLTHPSLESDPIGDFVKPAPYRFPPGQAPGLPEEYEKRRLKRIVGRLRASENTPAHAQDHAAVSLQQRRKRRLISIQREALQQLPVAEPLRAARDIAKPANRCFQCVKKRWHEEFLRPSANICPPPGQRIQFFSRALPPRPPLARKQRGQEWVRNLFRG